MALEVHIEKKLANYTLALDFSCGEEPLAVLGPSGAGKSMALRCIAGIEHPSQGRIVLQDRVLFDSSQRINLPSRERRVGMLFQSYGLFPHLTVRGNVAFGLQRFGANAREAQVTRHLEGMHLRGFADRFPRELSGGEQQRVALARALATEPDALLLDEPLSALDTHLRSQIQRQLAQTLADFRRPALFVTHNMEEAYRIAPVLLVLSKGRVAAFGPRGEIFQRPPTLEVALLTGLKNFSRCRPVAERRVLALDWRCELQAAAAGPQSPVFAGIRAHHVEIVENLDASPHRENVFPCWLVRKNEAPFHVTLYLRLHEPAPDAERYDLQAEVSRERWLQIEKLPQPWRTRLCPERVLLLPE